MLHAWYSGNTFNSHKGVVMIYYRHDDDCKAFYTMFNGDRDWNLDLSIGIARSEVATFLESSSSGWAT